MPEFIDFLLAVPAAIVMLLLATLVFDGLHVLLHRFLSSELALLRWLGDLHHVHHQFLDKNLNINTRLIASNVWCHVIPEYLVQICITLMLALIFDQILPRYALWLALGLETLVFLLIIKPTPGIDINHKPIEQLKPYRPHYFCLPEYHLLHHVYPDAYFSSWIKTLDHVLKTGLSLQGRKVVIVGANTEYEKFIYKKLREKETDVDVVDCESLKKQDSLDGIFKGKDILILCDQLSVNYFNLAEEFYLQNRNCRLPVEVWLFDGFYKNDQSIELVEEVKKLFNSEKIIYRHIVLTRKFSEKTANKLFSNIMRGWNYIPDRYNLAQFKRAISFYI